MTEKRFRIFTDLKTNEENIVDMIKGEPLTIHETCELLNSLDEKNQEQKEIITELKDIIYRDEDQIIGEWSSTISEDMEKLSKAYESDDIYDLIKYCKE